MLRILWLYAPLMFGIEGGLFRGVFNIKIFIFMFLLFLWVVIDVSDDGAMDPTWGLGIRFDAGKFSGWYRYSPSLVAGAALIDAEDCVKERRKRNCEWGNGHLRMRWEIMIFLGNFCKKMEKIFLNLTIFKRFCVPIKIWQHMPVERPTNAGARECGIIQDECCELPARTGRISSRK